MSTSAHVGSFEAVREFRAALLTFAAEAREALAGHDLEARRALVWLVEDRPRYWQQVQRAAEEAVVQAKIELERRRNSRLPDGEPPSCMEERKALARARARLEYAQQKVAAVRKWMALSDRAMTEYLGGANLFSTHLDGQLPLAVATLDRTLTALESYAALQTEPTRSAPLDPGPGASLAAPPAADVESASDHSVERKDTP
jgi:hypothetical protein